MKKDKTPPPYTTPKKQTLALLTTSPASSPRTITTAVDSSSYSIDSLSTNKTSLSTRSYNSERCYDDDDEEEDDELGYYKKGRLSSSRRRCSDGNEGGGAAGQTSCARLCFTLLGLLFVFVCVCVVLFGGRTREDREMMINERDWGADNITEPPRISNPPPRNNTSSVHPTPESTARSSSPSIVSQFIHLYKLPPPLDNDDLNENLRRPNSSAPNPHHHHHYYNTGLFRPPRSKLWDPHPQYIFQAFGRRFHVVLNQIPRTHSFILPGFRVTTHGRGASGDSVRESWVTRGNGIVRADQAGGGDEFEGCFYNGYVLGDMESSVAVSLCSGMTGHIRTSTGSYFIEPRRRSSYEHGNGGDLLEHEIYHQIVSQPHDEDGGDVGWKNKDPTHSSRKKDPPARNSSIPTTTNRPFNNLKISSYDYYSDEDYDSGEYSDEYEYSNEFGHQKHRVRSKRSLSTERYVELTVVTDQTMSRYHGDNLKHYVLTLLSIVALVYRDASIGNPVNIVLVNFHVLTDTDFSNSNDSGNGTAAHGTSASEMLRNFCKWQKEHNHPDDRHALHHDTALLLTRETICRNPWVGKCDTLGLAELGTMCDHYASCAIVQDNGLSAAFTIAHELGHVMNMPHDDDYKCQGFVSGGSGVKGVGAGGEEDDDEDDEDGGGNSSSSWGLGSGLKVQHFVMSRMLDHNTYPWAWSRCSRHFLTEFLDAGHGYCLEDKPHSNMLYNNDEENAVDTGGDGAAGAQQPGEIFSEHKQCELVFGPNSQLCSYMPPCRRLWCTNHGGPESEESEGCRTQHMPWADGTRCGANKWCQRGACVLKDLEKLKVVNGGWGGWQEFGECSRVCGGGVRKSYRECDEPKPRNGGKYCVGPRVRYESCHTFECGGGEGVRNSSGIVDFRGSQCGDYDGDNFNIHGLPEDVVWVPKYNGISPKDRCKLFCRVQGSSSYYLLKEKVIDGTTCGIDTFDICVNGACLPAGCDRRLHSSKTLDICGICGGDGSTCTTSQGSYNSTKYGYNTVTTIPSGASNIDIRQRSYDNTARDDNYLALFDPIANEYVLNGHFVVSMFRKTLHYGGSVVEYSGSDQVVERINSSSRPLKRGLEVRVLSVGKLKYPDIVFQFVISTGGSVSGGGGAPESSNYSYEWVGRRSSSQQSCSSVCSGVTLPFSSWECVRRSSSTGATTVTIATDCEGVEKPRHAPQACNGHCTLSYRLSCPESCVDARNNNYTVECVRTVASGNSSMRVGEKYCVAGGVVRGEGPDCLKECMGRKARWRWTEWSECSSGVSVLGRCSVNGSSSSRGVQMRNVWCQRFNWRSLVNVGVDNYEVVDGRECDGEKPVVRRACKVGGGGGICGEWGVDQWSPCSTSCGPGRIRALYACVLKTHSQTQILPPDYCAHSPKPVVERPCELVPCLSYSTSDWSDCDCEAGVELRNVTCLINGVASLDLGVCERAGVGERAITLSRACSPESVKACESFEYKTSEWSADCRLYNGRYYRYRVVSCEVSRCSGAKPESMLECGEWRVESGWGGCNGSCSVGVELRGVGCYVKGVRVEGHEDCVGAVGGRPSSERKCYHNCGKGNSSMRSLRMGGRGEEGFGGGVGGGVVSDDNSSNNSGGSSKAPYYYYNINSGGRGGTGGKGGDVGGSSRIAYKWVAGSWGKCTRMTTHKSSSSSCVPSQTTYPRVFRKHRQVKCVAESSTPPHRITTVPTAYCSESPQPEPSTNCTASELTELQPCPTWVSSEWSGCVVGLDRVENCGGSGNGSILHGVKRRVVGCVHDTSNASVGEGACAESVPRPGDVEECVVRGLGVAKETYCSYSYRWRVGNWSTCLFDDRSSTTQSPGGKGAKRACGGARGKKSRSVECLRSWAAAGGAAGPIITVVADEYCGVVKRSARVAKRTGRSRGAKPRESRECGGNKCVGKKEEVGRRALFKWIVGGWSNCSRPCGGYGLRSRPVSCHRSNSYDWTDPDPLPTTIPSSNNTHYCAPPKPKEYDYCIVRESCEDGVEPEKPTASTGPLLPLYEWATNNYSACACAQQNNSMSPFTSFQKRKVFCTSRVGGDRVGKVPARFCSVGVKPKRKRKCECNSYGSCAEVRDGLVRNLAPVQDGEYLLTVGGKVGVKVYCHGMTMVDAGAGPKEYVSLVGGEDSNYSEIYDKRLIRPESCPRNGSRMGSCECVQDRNRRVGVTRWGRVRVNVTNLVVDASDFTFSTSSTTDNLIPYGTAGDCYSSSMNCPQGRFSIDLRGTSFAVSSVTTWASTGHRATMRVIRKGYSQEQSGVSQFVQGKCGGYCGSCGVVKGVGLRVDVV